MNLAIYAEEMLSKKEFMAMARLKAQITSELNCERRLLNVLGILKSLISVSFEHGRNSDELGSDNAVFGDLLIKPKLFSLNKTLGDTQSNGLQ